jgi:PilZ domain
MDRDRQQTGLGRRAVDIGPKAEAGYAGAERRTGAVRREDQRARSLLTGKIVIGDGAVSHDCVIRNFSAKGARVRLAGAINLPGAVSLLVVKEGLLFDATIAWRRGDQIGLAFRGQYDLRNDTDPAHRGARALWTALAPL